MILAPTVKTLDYEIGPAEMAESRAIAARARASGNGGPQHVCLEIKGDIDQDVYERIRTALASAPYAASLTVSIDSNGGLFTSAYDVFAALHSHPAETKTALLEGRCESGALICALGADHRVARRDTRILLHRASATPEPQSGRWTAAMHQEMADLLRWLDCEMLGIFAYRTGATDAAAIAQALETEDYSSLDWCLEHGFIHEIAGSQ